MFLLLKIPTNFSFRGLLTGITLEPTIRLLFQLQCWVLRFLAPVCLHVARDLIQTVELLTALIALMWPIPVSLQCINDLLELAVVPFVVVFVVAFGEELFLALFALVRLEVVVDAFVHSEVALIRELLPADRARERFDPLVFRSHVELPVLSPFK